MVCPNVLTPAPLDSASTASTICPCRRRLAPFLEALPDEQRPRVLAHLLATSVDARPAWCVALLEAGAAALEGASRGGVAAAAARRGAGEFTPPRHSRAGGGGGWEGSSDGDDDEEQESDEPAGPPPPLLWLSAGSLAAAVAGAVAAATTTSHWAKLEAMMGVAQGALAASAARGNDAGSGRGGWSDDDALFADALEEGPGSVASASFSPMGGGGGGGQEGEEEEEALERAGSFASAHSRASSSTASFVSAATAATASSRGGGGSAPPASARESDSGALEATEEAAAAAAAASPEDPQVAAAALRQLRGQVRLARLLAKHGQAVPLPTVVRWAPEEGQAAVQRLLAQAERCVGWWGGGKGMYLLAAMGLARGMRSASLGTIVLRPESPRISSILPHQLNAPLAQPTPTHFATSATGAEVPGLTASGPPCGVTSQTLWAAAPCLAWRLANCCAATAPHSSARGTPCSRPRTCSRRPITPHRHSALALPRALWAQLLTCCPLKRVRRWW